MSTRADIMQGTLDLMVLRTLETLGPQHGWGIAQRLEQVSGEALRVNQGTLYPALLRLEQRRLIRSRWGTSENNRRARFYSLTAAGPVELRIYDVQGRLLRKLVEGRKPAGSHGVVWDGRDGDGSSVPTGTYFYELITDAGSQTRKAIRLE